MGEWLIIAVGLIALVALGLQLNQTRQQNTELLKKFIDLEKQQKTDRSQVHDENLLRDAVFQIVNDAFLTVDFDQRIVSMNQLATDLLGKNLVGETLIAATRSYDLDKMVQEARHYRKEVSEQIVEIKGKFIRARVFSVNELQNPVHLLLLRDETELVRLGRARRDMIANISHELRTPITTIGLLADTLLSGALKKPRRAKDAVIEIRRETDTLTQLVQEMRDLSLIESGQMPVKLMPMDLLEAVNLSIESLRSLLERKHQQVTVNIPENISVLADHNQIQRVLKNIIHNAIKFAPENGLIEVGVTVKDGEATISIYNNGPGVPPEDLPRIFERFFQVDRARSDGTGLGLAIARHIVISHGGIIRAENEDEGITFYFTLALA